MVTLMLLPVTNEVYTNLKPTQIVKVDSQISGLVRDGYWSG
jgi:hypothetical protein